MYIINYKEYDDGYYSGVFISSTEKNIDVSYDISDDYVRKYVKLIPEKEFKGRIDGEKKIREYIRYYYVNVLSKLDPEQVYKELERDSLITFGDGEFSHGYIVAAWFELYLGVEINCINCSELYLNKLKDIKPRWTMDILEDEIKKTIVNMRGFNSVRALYLFNQGEELERKADELEDRILNDKLLSQEKICKLSDWASDYRQGACNRRCDADMAEDAWRERRYKLIEESKKKQKRK